MNGVPTTFDLLYMQSLTGGVEVLEAGIPTEQALGKLVNHLAQAADFGPGATFHLVPTNDPLHQVRQELQRARELHAPLNSAHEAYAVILEELDEFKVEVWKKKRERNPERMREELTQLATMAIRAIEDLNL